MVISVSRAEDDAGLTLRAGKESGNADDDYEATIRPGESALGFTFEEWEAALGPQGERMIELAEDGSLRPRSDQFDAPSDGHA